MQSSQKAAVQQAQNQVNPSAAQGLPKQARVEEVGALTHLLHGVGLRLLSSKWQLCSRRHGCNKRVCQGQLPAARGGATGGLLLGQQLLARRGAAAVAICPIGRSLCSGDTHTAAAAAAEQQQLELSARAHLSLCAYSSASGRQKAWHATCNQQHRLPVQASHLLWACAQTDPARAAAGPPAPAAGRCGSSRRV